MKKLLKTLILGSVAITGAAFAEGTPDFGGTAGGSTTYNCMNDINCLLAMEARRAGGGTGAGTGGMFVPPELSGVANPTICSLLILGGNCTVYKKP